MEIDIKKSLNLINFFLIHYKCYNSIKFIIGTNLSYVGNIKLSFCNKFYTQNVTVIKFIIQKKCEKLRKEPRSQDKLIYKK